MPPFSSSRSASNEIAAPVTASSLSAEHARKSFGGVEALDDVSLSAAPGECLAFVGESGAGKTTLLRCFNRMVQPDEGRILVDGVDVRNLDPIQLRRRMGYVPQDGGLMPHWRVGGNVALVPWLLRTSHREASDRALDLVGLPADAYRDRWPRELSGGQRQRVAIARALAAGPSVLLLDEPFGALDAITRADLQETFARLRTELRMTVLLVTHDLHEAARLADRVAVFRAGKLEQAGTVSELASSPASEYVSTLLDRSRLEV